MSTWLLPRSELTPEQLRAIDLNHSEHQVISGAPGSGKTQILLHRADELRRRLKAPSNRFRILVFTNVLKKYIRSALELLDLPEDTVTTFDDWCKDLYLKHVGRTLPNDNEKKQRDFGEVRLGVAAKLAAKVVPLPLLDFILVDEGQDLDRVAFDILRLAARHVTVCIDSKQQIYAHGSSEADILAALGLRRRNLTLLDAYRCSPLIARLAGQLLENPVERQQYLAQVRIGQTGRETPLLYVASSFEDERRRLIDVLRQRLLTDQRIAVLFPMRDQVFGFAKALAEAGIEVENLYKLDFGTSRPKVISFHSAKGLTFDSILIPRLVPGSFPPMLMKNARQMLFVAITRASGWVYMSTCAGNELPLLEVFYRLEAERALTVQRAAKPLTDWPKPESQPPTTSDELDFL